MSTGTMSTGTMSTGTMLTGEGRGWRADRASIACPPGERSLRWLAERHHHFAANALGGTPTCHPAQRAGQNVGCLCAAAPVREER
jgi:hypothetical protein